MHRPDPNYLACYERSGGCSQEGSWRWRLPGHNRTRGNRRPACCRGSAWRSGTGASRRGSNRGLRRLNWNRRRSNLAKGRQAQDDVDTLLSLGRGIILDRLLPEKIDCLTNAGITKLNPWDNNGVQLGRDPGRAACISCERVCKGSDGLAVLAHRFFPAFLHLPEVARSRLVVGFLAVTVFRVIEFFLPSPRCHVVGIEIEDLVVFLMRKIVTAGVVITVGLCQQRFYFLDFGDELRAHCLVEIAGLMQVREQLRRRATVGVVAIA